MHEARWRKVEAWGLRALVIVMVTACGLLAGWLLEDILFLVR